MNIADKKEVLKILTDVAGWNIDDLLASGSGYDWLLDLPLDDMPLHINDPGPLTYHIVRRRLELAK